MHIPQNNAVKAEISPECTVWEYRFESEKMSFSTARIDGRYPSEGRVVNEKCEEVYFVVDGSGIIHSEKGDFEIQKGDVYHFEMGEKYWVEGRELYVALTNAPKWFPDQHKEVE